mmetsp:Transcript_19128/g.29129  ORF Transcript_19128/g.29129 Transcript_19128/m.29129 type:complete len:412 (-) Transcript_19128:107-1342(-)
MAWYTAQERLDFAREAFFQKGYTPDDLGWEFDSAPTPVIAFLVGGVFMLFSFYSWLRRARVITKTLEERFGVEDGDLPVSVYSRARLVAAMDDGDTLYSLAYTTGTSFLLLGGFQVAYVTTYVIMMAAYAFFALLDITQIAWTYTTYDSLRDLVVTAKDYKKTENAYLDIKQATISFMPSNVYQNFALNALEVAVVFTAQVALMTFQGYDLIVSKDNSCIDFLSENTPSDEIENCPTVGTLSSWLFYVLGIMLLNVFLLGPGNSNGDAQFDTNHWSAILLGSKKGGTYQWKSPHGLGIKGSKSREVLIRNDDFRVFCRLSAGAIVNSFGFRLLLNALPILLAGKVTVFRLIFQAMGVIYIAKMDDATGFRFEFNENPVEKEQSERDESVTAQLKDCEVGKFLPNIYKNKLS